MSELDAKLYELAIQFQQQHGPGPILELFKKSLLRSGMVKFGGNAAATGRFLGIAKSTIHDWKQGGQR